ncbi:cryptochrome/photolyase family protein [Pararhizobium haloflavum]|uniref:cryptochrome/photolyase family protein n=1 Tax=Pararhizobium haloflavum TaxID=2037914 RepID=UPI000C19B777|nr:deoxyribodipyrimidine photo-lyase [Pararhizobium haloflavum]
MASDHHDAEEAETTSTLVWFRRDLRVADNLALSEAIGAGGSVTALFVLDDEAGERPMGAAQRVWLHHSLEALAGALRKLDVQLVLKRGNMQCAISDAIEALGARHVFWNRIYEPSLIKIDDAMVDDLGKRGIAVRQFDGQLLHEPGAVTTGKDEPYRVYTPFWRALERLGEPRAPLDPPEKAKRKAKSIKSDDLSDWALLPRRPDWSKSILAEWSPGEAGAHERLDDFIEGPFVDYDDARDFPDREGTSRLSPHLAFGEITPYQIWEATKRRPKTVGNNARTTFRKEVGWREFAYHLLVHNPKLATRNFNSRFDDFPWSSNKTAFNAWKAGRTGYPIVDAGMRQLWQTGWMHNRVRMVCASFLTKHLLLHWREGERWFWDTLVDADPASNAAQWQWVAGSGADAAPYFRIFNPVIQGEKFDPQGDYVRQFVPELEKLGNRFIHKPWDAADDILDAAGIKLGETYPKPIVDHQTARQRALTAYDKIKDDA